MKAQISRLAQTSNHDILYAILILNHLVTCIPLGVGLSYIPNPIDKHKKNAEPSLSSGNGFGRGGGGLYDTIHHYDHLQTGWKKG